MKRFLGIAAVLCIATSLHAQGSSPILQWTQTAPSGACTPGVIPVVTSTGVVSTCQSGTWGQVAGGGGTLTPNFVVPIYSGVPTSDTIAGSGAGNGSITGTQNTVLGTGAGAAITVPAAGANPQLDTVIGYQACPLMTTARETTCIGGTAGSLYVGNGQGVEDGLSMFIGSQAGAAFPGTGVSDTDDLFIGQKAGINLTSGGFNIFFGNHAAQSLLTSVNSVWIGNFTGSSLHATDTSTDDTVLGYGVLSGLNGASNNNVAIGWKAASAQLIPVQNVFIGAGVASLGTGSSTGATCVGFDACQNVAAAPRATALGALALQALTTGNNNTAMGGDALTHANTGNENTAVGQAALFQVTGNHSGNTGVGYQAGGNSTADDNSTYIGHKAQPSAATGVTNETVIGDTSTGAGSNSVQLGNASVTKMCYGNGICWYYGAGVPAINCAIGSLYSNTSGGASTTLYVCTALNTWTAK